MGEGLGGRGLKTVCLQSGYAVPTFNRVIEYQPIASEILTQPSHYISEESNLLADQELVEPGSCLGYPT